MGLTRFNPFDNSIKLYQPIPSVIYMPDNNFEQVIEDYTEFIWGSIAGTGSGLICVEPANGRFKTYNNIPEKQGSLSSNIVYSVYQDLSGIIRAKK